VVDPQTAAPRTRSRPAVPRFGSHGLRTTRIGNDARLRSLRVCAIVRLPEHNEPRLADTLSAPLVSEDRERALEILRGFSVRLLGKANRQPKEPTRGLAAAVQPFVELGERLSALIGSEGYRALITSALQLAASDFPMLNAVRPAQSPPGRLVGLPRGSGQTMRRDVLHALAATLAALLWLLEQLIGEDLSHAVLNEVWPWLADNGSACRQAVPRLTG
jgi:hypothetical protein